MSDWQVGDLALCVSRHSLYPPAVKVGAAFTVSYVGGGFLNHDDHFVGTSLSFRDAPSMDDDARYDARRFRKVTPEEADEFDRETIALMNRVEQPA